MASNVFSHLMSSNAGEPSIYQTLQEHDEYLNASSNSSELHEAEPQATAESEFHDEPGEDLRSEAMSRPGLSSARSPHMWQAGSTPESASRQGKEHDVAEDDVPHSLLIEDEENPFPGRTQQAASIRLNTTPHNVRWQSVESPERANVDSTMGPDQRRGSTGKGRPLGMTDPKVKASWMWANVENLDRFLDEVYDYYLGHGIWSILLSRALRLITLSFIVAFSTFLTSCIDYSAIPNSKSFSQILIPKCTKNMSGSTNILLWLFAFFWIFKLFDFVRDVRRLRVMQNFYVHLLEIRDSDMQTISWQEIVKRLMNLRDLNPSTATALNEEQRRFIGTQSKQRMDAHDIANRLMRRDNYFIALVNKDILDFTLPIPFLRNKQLFSRTLEWNLHYCILDFVFNQHGQVRSLFLRDTHRKALSEGFRNRFLFAGFISLACAPFAVLYYMLYYFFRYFTEFQRNPSQIGSRQYTPYAEWKFREFNELPHLFERRTKMSYPFASRYVDQFPKDRMIQISGFVAFVCGALASVLAVASLIDPESFLSFEVTPDRTVLFYLGVFGTIWAIARGSMPEENLVFDPEYALSNVIEYTHYMPSHWKGRLHTNEVRVEFARLYQLKLYIFVEEILSIILAPFILWFSLPKCCDRLVDFFREFTIHVDGIGYVCSFAMFDFKRGGANANQVDAAAARDLREEYYSTKDGKLLASYYGFIDNYVNNQRTGNPVLHPAPRQTFHAPPAFPGLMTSTLGDQPRPHPFRQSVTERQRGAQRPVGSTHAGGAAFENSVNKRTPRFAPTGPQQSPVASLLLDPRHQPSHASVSRARRWGSPPKSKMRHTTLEMQLEDDELAPEAVKDHQEWPAEEALNESQLDDSWKSTHDLDDSDDEGGEDGKADPKGPGVLGLAYQFSKAQSEGRPGIKI